MLSLHAIFLAICGVCLLLLTLVLVRRGLLTARYALGWVCVSAVAVLGAPIFAFLSTQVAFVRLTPAGFSLVVAILFLLAVCVQLSVSLSGLIDSTQDIAERLALVEAETRSDNAGGLAVADSAMRVEVSLAQGVGSDDRERVGEAQAGLVRQ